MSWRGLAVVILGFALLVAAHWVVKSEEPFDWPEGDDDDREVT